jgi:hypothetical protein
MSSYDHPNNIVRSEWFAGEAGGGATTEYGKFRVFQKSRLKKVHAIVTTAGTATAHGFNVFRGTTSVGAIALGTAAAAGADGAISASSALLDLELAAGQQVSVKSLADGVGKAHIIYEYHTLQDAAKS